jgi:hypothetical protein
MHERLRNLIERFREAQDNAVSFYVNSLCPALGLRLPTSGGDWMNLCGEFSLQQIRSFNGVALGPHGYGIEFTFPTWSIDMDWGENGEPDGFDTWRLHLFDRLNPTELPTPSVQEVRGWLEHAFDRGLLIRDSHLYYSPLHRARRR